MSNLRIFLFTSLTLVFVGLWNNTSSSPLIGSKNVPPSETELVDQLRIAGYIESEVLYFEITHQNNIDFTANYIVLQDDILMKSGEVVLPKEQITIIALSINRFYSVSYNIKLFVEADSTIYSCTVLVQN